MTTSTDPRANHRCIGHEAQERILLESWQRGVMPHSMLFCGAKGIGKATFAYRLVRFILSGGQGEASMFGPTDLAVDADSAVVRRIENGAHGDFMVVTPDDSTATPTIKVDAVRKIQHFLSLTPSENPWRVVLIDSVDEMNPNAANALLKILEEPPSYCIIILICHSAGNLLPTLRSRCRRFDFSAPTYPQFEKILSANAMNLDEEQSHALFALSHGSAGNAISLHHHHAFDLYRTILGLLENYPTLNHAAIGQCAQKIAGAKSHAQWEVWKMVWEHVLIRLALYQAGCLEPSTYQEQQVFQVLSSQFSPQQLQTLLAKSQELHHRSETLHLDRKQAIQILMQMAA